MSDIRLDGVSSRGSSSSPCRINSQSAKLSWETADRDMLQLCYRLAFARSRFKALT